MFAGGRTRLRLLNIFARKTTPELLTSIRRSARFAAMSHHRNPVPSVK
jgi:hypothetical protein